jgi:hypothetical protein
MGKLMYVYFIEAFGEHELKRIKIGSSQHPKERLAELQVGSPVKLKLMGVVKCQSNNHARQVEKLAHKIFHAQRRRGEWFRLSRKHIEQMKSLIERSAVSTAASASDRD